MNDSSRRDLLVFVTTLDRIWLARPRWASTNGRNGYKDGARTTRTVRARMSKCATASSLARFERNDCGARSRTLVATLRHGTHDVWLGAGLQELRSSSGSGGGFQTLIEGLAPTP